MTAKMIVGFTGTSRGMTPRQRDALRRLFIWLNPRLLSHGDCVGADAQAHSIFRSLPASTFREISIHPHEIEKYRSFSMGDYISKPLPYLQRNECIAGGLWIQHRFANCSAKGTNRTN